MVYLITKIRVSLQFVCACMCVCMCESTSVFLQQVCFYKCVPTTSVFLQVCSYNKCVFQCVPAGDDLDGPLLQQQAVCERVRHAHVCVVGLLTAVLTVREEQHLNTHGNLIAPEQVHLLLSRLRPLTLQYTIHPATHVTHCNTHDTLQHT